MSEGTCAGAMSSQISASGGGGGSAASSADPLPADPLPAGETIDELQAANDGPNPSKKRQYPEPGFAVERSGPLRGRGSYTNSFKVKAAGFTRVLCADGNPVGNSGAAKIFGVDRKRIISWVKEEDNLKGLLEKNPKLSKAKSIHAGAAASTVDIDQALEDYINEQRKQHHGCGRREVMKKLLELKPDALGGVSATATRQEAEEFKSRFNNWYQRFRRRRGFRIVEGNMVEQQYPDVQAEECKVPKPDKVLKYGTAGFRDRAEVLESTFLRMGMLAVLRSRKTGMAVGLMVTASHNAEVDNGIKMVDPSGGMLSQDWEGHAEMLANAPNGKVSEALAQICTKENILLVQVKNEEGKECTPCVYVAKDTRPHSPKLAALALHGIKLVGGEGLDQGVLTTPMLHHCVRMSNEEAGSGPFWGKPEWRGEKGYYKMLASSYADLISSAEDSKKRKASWFRDAAEKEKETGKGGVHIDAAHGVGAPKMESLAKVLAEEMPGGELSVEVRNRVGEGQLNEGCGAEWVQKKGVPPSGVSAKDDIGKRLCSFDGDADRLVYHFFDATGKWVLFDGDKIAALCAAFIHEELANLGLDKEFSMSVVQTAYANGGSTQYLRSNGVPVAMAKTGVKFVHHEAEKYDVGIYFEANGHGTVLFKDKVLARLTEMQQNSTGDQSAEQSVRRLLSSAALINQAVGDALSDLLFCEAVLRLKGWGCEEWASLYMDLPSRQAKTAVADRSVITCSPDETSALSPPGLQATLDKTMATTPNGRCFVRPSGTEDVVRIYAEAATQKDADELCLKAMQTVHDIAGGVGDRPVAV